MKKIIRFTFCILALLLTFSQPMAAAAASGPDIDHPCKLTLHYVREGAAFKDLEVEIYRVAAYRSDGSYAVTDTFAKYPVKIHNMTSQKEWQESTQAMVAYIEADAPTPTATGKTDTAGTVVFENLETGLYLVMGTDVKTDTMRFRFQPFFIFLPTPGQDGSYDYEMEANPKAGTVTPISVYKVVKLWKDSANKKNRPSAVTVDILKDGVFHHSVELNQSNNWSYSWETVDVNSRWSVAEKSVPNGYTVAISTQNGTFTITNEYPGSSGDRPQTGDSTQLWPYLVAMCGSGLALILLASGKKRK